MIPQLLWKEEDLVDKKSGISNGHNIDIAHTCWATQRTTPSLGPSLQQNPGSDCFAYNSVANCRAQT